MALNRSDKSRILRRYFPGMTRNSEMSTEPNTGKMKRPRVASGPHDQCSAIGYFPLPLLRAAMYSSARRRPVSRISFTSSSGVAAAGP